VLCKEFRAAVDSYVDESLAPSKQQEMDAHADGCPQCRADLAVAMLLSRPPAPDPDTELTVGELARVALSSSVTRLAHGIIAQALRDKATEVLLDPVTDGLRVAYRVEDELREVITMPGYIRQPLTARLKQMADLSTSDRRTPQCGDIAVRMDDRRYLVRVLTHPEGRMERLVLVIEYPEQQENISE